MTTPESQKDASQDNSLRAILITIFIGILTILFISISVCLNKTEKGVFWSVFGLSLLMGLSSMLCGGGLGFLFGIPLSLQRNNQNTAPTAGGGATAAARPRE